MRYRLDSIKFHFQTKAKHLISKRISLRVSVMSAFCFQQRKIDNVHSRRNVFHIPYVCISVRVDCLRSHFKRQLVRICFFLSFSSFWLMTTTESERAKKKYERQIMHDSKIIFGMRVHMARCCTFYKVYWTST